MRASEVSDIRTWGLLMTLGASVFVIHAAYQIRNPDWPSRAWWQRHRALTHVLGGRSRGRRVGAWFELVGAAILLIAGLVVVFTYQ